MWKVANYLGAKLRKLLGDVQLEVILSSERKYIKSKLKRKWLLQELFIKLYNSFFYHSNLPYLKVVWRFFDKGRKLIVSLLVISHDAHEG